MELLITCSLSAFLIGFLVGKSKQKVVVQPIYNKEEKVVINTVKQKGFKSSGPRQGKKIIEKRYDIN